MAAITLDTTSSGHYASGNATETQSHTNSGSLLAVIVLGNTLLNASGVTYNGVAMTQVVTPGSSNADASIWVLLNPATGAHNIVVSKATTEPVAIFGISFLNATSYSATGKSDASSTAPSVTVNTNRDTGFVIAGCVVENDPAATYGGSGTELSSDSAFASFRATYHSFSSNANITENWTCLSNPWATAGLEISNAGGSGFFGFM